MWGKEKVRLGDKQYECTFVGNKTLVAIGDEVLASHDPVPGTVDAALDALVNRARNEHLPFISDFMGKIVVADYMSTKDEAAKFHQDSHTNAESAVGNFFGMRDLQSLVASPLERRPLPSDQPSPASPSQRIPRSGGPG